jgi:uncharacterized protein YdaU (DUF1376 family)
MSVPFMQLYVADYLGDTRHLTTEQHGAYLLLLMTMWRSEGVLPDDPIKLARIAGLTVSRWHKISADVLAFFTPCEGGFTQRRLSAELAIAEEKSSKRSQSGKAGARAKALKSNKVASANASRLLKHSPEPEPDSKRVTNVTLVRPPDLFADFWSRWPVKKSRKAAHAAYLKALKETDHGTLVAAVDAQRRWPEWAVARYIPHAATWLNRGGWADEPRGSEGEGVAGNQKASGNRSGDTSFADIAARRKREREAGMEIPGRQAAVSGDDFGWGIGAIDGQCAAGDWQG